MNHKPGSSQVDSLSFSELQFQTLWKRVILDKHSTKAVSQLSDIPSIYSFPIIPDSFKNMKLLGEYFHYKQLVTVRRQISLTFLTVCLKCKMLEMFMLKNVEFIDACTLKFYITNIIDKD